MKRDDARGARCKGCGGHFVVHGTPEERTRHRCQCSPQTPLEFCKPCEAGHGEHPEWCAVVKEA